MPRPKLLIVDGDDERRGENIVLYNGWRFETEGVSNGEEAVERLGETNGGYGLVFMDHQLPGINGLEATAAIRGFNEGVSIYLRGQTEIPAEQLQQAGATGYIGRDESVLLLLRKHLL